MNEDECFPLLLSQRERSALELDAPRVVSVAEVGDLSEGHELSEEEFPSELRDLDRTVPAPLDVSPPAA